MRVIQPGEKLPKKEIEYFAAMAGDCYMDDPVHSWVTKNEKIRRNFITHFTAERLHTSNGEDYIYVDDENRGICIFRKARNEYTFTDFLKNHHWLYMYLYFPLFFRTLAAYSGLDVKEFPEDCYIISPVFVSPDHQGQGIATALIKQGIADLTAKGFTIGLEAQSDRNVAFYEKLGFKTFKTVDFQRGNLTHYYMMYSQQQNDK